jgi:hypothetical protein
VITFFTGFGQFIIMTIFYSWLSAFFILCPLLMLTGPEGRAGELTLLKTLIGGSTDAQPMQKKPEIGGNDNKPPGNVMVSSAEAVMLDTDNEAEI